MQKQESVELEERSQAVCFFGWAGENVRDSMVREENLAATHTCPLFVPTGPNFLSQDRPPGKTEFSSL